MSSSIPAAGSGSPAAPAFAGWERLHPLSPFVRGGRAAVALVVILVAASAQRHNGSSENLLVDLGLVALILVLGLVNWLVTRWRFDGATLQYETGLIRRDVRRLPVARIQAVDVVQPLMARFLGVAEVQIHVGGASKDTRLAYLSQDRAAELRTALLAAHHGHDPRTTPEPQEVAAMTVPTGRLVGSVLLSGGAMIFALVLVAVVAIAVASPKVAGAVIATMAVYLIAMGAGVWRRFNVLYGFTVAYAPDGVRVRRGLLGTVSETIPLRRVQAVRQIEPLLWRLFGWCRLEVDLAGVPTRQRGSGTGQVRKALLPVGTVPVARSLREQVIGTVGFVPTPPPRRAMLKAPLSYHFLAAGHDSTIAIAVTGRLRKVTSWVPLEKLQSIRRVEGPLQRRLGLATVHLDVAGRRVEAAFRDRDGASSRQLVDELAALSRVARGRALPDARPPSVPAHPDGEPVPAEARSTAGTDPAAAGDSSPARVPPGWHADPSHRHRHRYWDGAGWTQYVHDEGDEVSSDPL
ncbi:MAG TPA: PH domain-containing protein [Acidimicrobiales bacterium]|nr:PH domain-containing protein [Acidimicrobiales bacterium]